MLLIHSALVTALGRRNRIAREWEEGEDLELRQPETLQTAPGFRPLMGLHQAAYDKSAQRQAHLETKDFSLISPVSL